MGRVNTALSDSWSGGLFLPLATCDDGVSAEGSSRSERAKMVATRLGESRAHKVFGD